MYYPFLHKEYKVEGIFIQKEWYRWFPIIKLYTVYKEVSITDTESDDVKITLHIDSRHLLETSAQVRKMRLIKKYREKYIEF